MAPFHLHDATQHVRRRRARRPEGQSGSLSACLSVCLSVRCCAALRCAAGDLQGCCSLPPVSTPAVCNAVLSAEVGRAEAHSYAATRPPGRGTEYAKAAAACAARGARRRRPPGARSSCVLAMHAARRLTPQRMSSFVRRPATTPFAPTPVFNRP
jgi:hypothetical protein